MRARQREYQAAMNKLLLLRSLNSNAGSLAQLLAEAQEQEDNEALLAYCFTWMVGSWVPLNCSECQLSQYTTSASEGSGRAAASC